MRVGYRLFVAFDNIVYTQELVVTISRKAVLHAQDVALSSVLADLVTQNGTLEYYHDDRRCEYILSGVGDLQLQL